ncbi:MAG: polymerase subunit delta [Fusobacteriaceae bacterium]|jgi:DNA polymerase-3 subunit delta|nr:polymerase delta [Fusobacteriales bacterium]MDN5303719.1 polymerase subunit delta [Fusobacteriaceae bacterium]
MFYILTGDYSIELEYNELIKKHNYPITTFDATQKDEFEIFLQKISTNSMFGNNETIVLKRAEKLSKLSDFIKTISNFNILNKIVIILINKKLTAKQIKSCEAFAKVIIGETKNEKEFYINYIKNELKIKTNEAFQLTEMIGHDIHKIKNEIEKLKNYFYDEEFNLEKAKNIISINEEYNSFEAIENLLLGNPNEVYKMINKDKSHMLILYTLAKEFQTILKLTLLINEGKVMSTNNYNKFKDNYEHNKHLFNNSHPYAVFKKLQYINKYTITSIKEILKEVLITEANIKNGLIKDDIAIEILIKKVVLKYENN